MESPEFTTNKTFLGIEIGGTKLQLVTGTADGKILTKHRFDINRDQGAEGIKLAIEDTIRKNYIGEVQAVGIGFGGPVNVKTGQIATSFHIEGWSEFNFVEWLQPIVNAPVYLENDANVAGLGEAIHGAGKGYDLVLYITIGSGVGGGLVVDNVIYHGAIPGEVEIGHIRMNKEGDTFQSRCSGWAIDEKIRKAIGNNPKSLLSKLAGNERRGEARFLKKAMEQDDPEALQLFESTIDDLAYGLSHAIHLFHPQVIILGGGFSLIGQILAEHIQRKIPSYLMEAFHPGPLIKLAGLKEDAVPVGAILLAHQNFSKSKINK
ncbi:MAG: ROK family protein, partial [Flavitalea sp.]